MLQTRRFVTSFLSLPRSPPGASTNQESPEYDQELQKIIRSVQKRSCYFQKLIRNSQNQDRLVVATPFGAWVEARAESERKQSRSEMQRKRTEEPVRRQEAVQRKCAMMPSSHEAGHNFAN